MTPEHKPAPPTQIIAPGGQGGMPQGPDFISLDTPDFSILNNEVQTSRQRFEKNGNEPIPNAIGQYIVGKIVEVGVQMPDGNGGQVNQMVSGRLRGIHADGTPIFERSGAMASREFRRQNVAAQMPPFGESGKPITEPPHEGFGPVGMPNTQPASRSAKVAPQPVEASYDTTGGEQRVLPHAVVGEGTMSDDEYTTDEPIIRPQRAGPNVFQRRRRQQDTQESGLFG